MQKKVYRCFILVFNVFMFLLQASITYTTYADIESYVTTMSESDGFYIDCLLNDNTTLDLSGNSDSDIAISTGLTSAYATKFKEMCPDVRP